MSTPAPPPGPPPPPWWDVRSWLKRPKEETATQRYLRRLVIAVIGGTLLFVGVLMVILPGPGFPIVVVALAILGAEFVWARRLLRQGRVQVGRGTRLGSRLLAWIRGIKLPERRRGRNHDRRP